MRLLTIVLGVFLSISSVFSQQDKTAKDILDKSMTVFAGAGGIKSSFSFTLENTKSKTNEVFNGNISMKGNKFMIETPDYLAWYDGTNQWVYLKDNNEVNLTKPDSSDDAQMINPSVILSMYKKGFSSKYLGEKTVNGKKVSEIELLPQNKNELKKIVLQIDKENQLPSYIQLQYTNGINNIIKIVKYQLNQQFSDSLFSFDKKQYPEVDIIDLR